MTVLADTGARMSCMFFEDFLTLGYARSELGGEPNTLQGFGGGVAKVYGQAGIRVKFKENELLVNCNWTK